jgi:hypothetical protein
MLKEIKGKKAHGVNSSYILNWKRGYFNVGEWKMPMKGEDLRRFSYRLGLDDEPYLKLKYFPLPKSLLFSSRNSKPF